MKVLLYLTDVMLTKWLTSGNRKYEIAAFEIPGERDSGFPSGLTIASREE